MTDKSVRCTEEVYLPAGWKREDLADTPGFSLYTEPQFGGMVTVDYKARAYRLGMSRHGPVASTKQYGGRGWRDALEQDATACLYAAVNRT